MSPRSSDDGSPVDAARAMERVLRAEREAELLLAATQCEAQAVVEAARQRALARVNRSLERIARWQRGHAQALEIRLAALQGQADAATRALPLASATQIDAAVAQVAAELTGAHGAHR